MIICPRYNYFLFLLAKITPLLKDLIEYIVPRYAAHWKTIGTLLGLSSGVLETIEAGWPINVSWCCQRMLEKWLEVDTNASWGKLFTVIESDAVMYALNHNQILLLHPPANATGKLLCN